MHGMTNIRGKIIFLCKQLYLLNLTQIHHFLIIQKKPQWVPLGLAHILPHGLIISTNILSQDLNNSSGDEISSEICNSVLIVVINSSGSKKENQQNINDSTITIKLFRFSHVRPDFLDAINIAEQTRNSNFSESIENTIKLSKNNSPEAEQMGPAITVTKQEKAIPAHIEEHGPDHSNFTVEQPPSLEQWLVNKKFGIFKFLQELSRLQPDSIQPTIKGDLTDHPSSKSGSSRIVKPKQNKKCVRIDWTEMGFGCIKGTIVKFEINQIIKRFKKSLRTSYFIWDNNVLRGYDIILG